MECASNVVNGYTDKVSYTPGEQMQVFINSKSTLGFCRLDIYSVSGKLSFSVKAFLLVQTPNVINASAEGFNYSVTAEFPVPEIESGVYMIEHKIPFIVKATGPVDITVVYPSNTANAYCDSGGKNLYSSVDRPSQVSFLRPIPLQDFSGICLEWFSQLAGVSVGFIADVDLDDHTSFYSSKVISIVGHNEYWTRQARLNFDRFVNKGGHALILSGNTMWWQVRYSDDGTKMICYKSVVKDPISEPLLKTTLWTHPLLNYPILPSIGADFQHGGYGLNNDNGWNGYKLLTSTSPLLEGLNLQKGDIIHLPTAEYDGAPISWPSTEERLEISNDSLSCDKIEVIGYDKGFRVVETYGTFIVYKPNHSSGYVINTASTDWCSSNGMGGTSGDAIKKITWNAVSKLLNGEPVFSQ